MDEAEEADYRDAGFVDVHTTSGFTFELAGSDERIWTVFGTKP